MKRVGKVEAKPGAKWTQETFHGKEGCHGHREEQIPKPGTPGMRDPHKEDEFP